MTGSRFLVAVIVVAALVAYSGVLWVLATRRTRTFAWKLLMTKFIASFIRTGGWLGLVLWERPEWYDVIPLMGWPILAAQVVSAVALWRLSRHILNGDDRLH